MRQETADTVLHLLTDAVDDGIAQPASIPGYSVAGKTGTAQIAGPVQVENADGEIFESWRVHRRLDRLELHRPPARQRSEDRDADPDPPSGDLRPGRRWPSGRTACFADLMPQVLDYLAIPPDRPAQPVAQP